MILYIKQAGCEILHNGKILRTPVKLNIKRSDLSKYEKMMKFKSIRLYDIIDSEEKFPFVQSIIPYKSTFVKKTNREIQRTIVKNNKVNKTRVVDRIQNVPIKEYLIEETGYHDSIESDVDINIDVDIDSDDILKQLLSNI